MDKDRARFSVEGSFITKRARDILLSEMPSKAWRLIAMGLVGPEADRAARGILDATHRLEGVNELELVEEDRDDPEVQRYLRDLAYIYAGRVKINGAWYRPVARAVPNEAAARFAGELDTDTPVSDMRRWMQRVGTWFLREGEIVRIVEQKLTLWEPCGELPHWWDEHPNEAAAVADFEAKRGKVPTRGRGSKAMKDASASLRLRSQEMDEEARAIDRITEAAKEIESGDRFNTQCADIAEKVRQQAGDDLFEMVIEASDGGGFGPTPERRVMVPRAPFWNWALDHTHLAHMAPPWEPVSQPGMKLPFNSPYHTDWMLGAGFDLGDDYDALSPVTKAAGRERFRIQEQLGHYECAVLVDHGEAMGTVGKEILVLPHLGPAYAEAAMEPGVIAIVTEVGGELAHLATIGHEMGWTIMRVPDAMTRYPEGKRLHLMPATGQIFEGDRV